jgi:hypothetical protein
MKLILASASWCGPCKIIKSKLQSENLIEKVEIKDPDTDYAFFKTNNIKSVPRLLVMDGETVVEVIQGADDIIQRIRDES